ncbi:MAG TPA: HlyD family efflux transporter periplasmic adaptor subunit [Niabella sp.]|nr:HlyD family efflux transporter periplasmic adaptor subunit [Chitinophagaceae bacterium]HRN46800.1 HlyD family efflux transporter periplasmic adaptor subunit [Niabella sp.]HRO85256.1 HlyD family efflux transporter periplasmic adaptor subunit [Niabella sp.]HUN02188.1 HlyD family efflux transporter periplasmic adaptor subunit [Niabella sp.]
MKKLYIFFLATIVVFSSCNNQKDFDAAGNFEADEVIVSAQQNGAILSFEVTEGQKLDLNQSVGQIDIEAQRLQKDQTSAVITSLQQKTVIPDPQIEIARKQLAVQEEQLVYLNNEKRRLQNLVNADAAPQKQLDDLNQQIVQAQKQIEVTKQQINSYSETAANQNRAILSEKNPLEKSTALIQYQIHKGQIINPVAGTILTKYAMVGEMATIGRPLYKIANIDTLTLKAYITGDQLPQIKLGQSVKVRIDDGKGGYKNYQGAINWISDKSEFTPKTIQTRRERENLVYAIKIRVKNDGFLKIGMYGEAIFK